METRTDTAPPDLGIADGGDVSPIPMLILLSIAGDVAESFDVTNRIGAMLLIKQLRSEGAGVTARSTQCIPENMQEQVRRLRPAILGVLDVLERGGTLGEAAELFRRFQQ